MAKIVSELKVGGCLLLKIDKMPNLPYNKVVVDECEYDLVPSYDLGDYNIAVNSLKSLNNKDIEFVKQ
ncbi:MAG: hypothetical protein IJ447_08345 [Clostridia bacterium]|nr:hypothetical protein [Clostridia bacterium]